MPQAYFIREAYFILRSNISLVPKERISLSPSFSAKKRHLPVSFFGGEGGTRTLAPGFSRPTPLPGAPRHQLEYFSMVPLYIKFIGFLNGGEKGIRTLVGLLPNGFQDRLVMTASISLRNGDI